MLLRLFGTKLLFIDMPEGHTRGTIGSVLAEKKKKSLCPTGNWKWVYIGMHGERKSSCSRNWIY